MQHVGGVFSVYDGAGNQVLQARNTILMDNFVAFVWICATNDTMNANLVDSDSSTCKTPLLVLGSYSDSATMEATVVTTPEQGDTPSIITNGMTANWDGASVVMAPVTFDVVDGTARLQALFSNDTGDDAAFDAIALAVGYNPPEPGNMYSAPILAHANVAAAMVPAGETRLVKYEVTFS